MRIETLTEENSAATTTKRSTEEASGKLFKNYNNNNSNNNKSSSNNNCISGSKNHQQNERLQQKQQPQQQQHRQNTRTFAKVKNSNVGNNNKNYKYNNNYIDGNYIAGTSKKTPKENIYEGNSLRKNNNTSSSGSTSSSSRNSSPILLTLNDESCLLGTAGNHPRNIYAFEQQQQQYNNNTTTTHPTSSFQHLFPSHFDAPPKMIDSPVASAIYSATWRTRNSSSSNINTALPPNYNNDDNNNNNNNDNKICCQASSLISSLPSIAKDTLAGFISPENSQQQQQEQHQQHPNFLLSNANIGSVKQQQPNINSPKSLRRNSSTINLTNSSLIATSSPGEALHQQQEQQQQSSYHSNHTTTNNSNSFPNLPRTQSTTTARTISPPNTASSSPSPFPLMINSSNSGSGNNNNTNTNNNNKPHSGIQGGGGGGGGKHNNPYRKKFWKPNSGGGGGGGNNNTGLGLLKSHHFGSSEEGLGGGNISEHSDSCLSKAESITSIGSVSPKPAINRGKVSGKSEKYQQQPSYPQAWKKNSTPTNTTDSIGDHPPPQQQHPSAFPSKMAANLKASNAGEVETPKNHPPKPDDKAANDAPPPPTTATAPAAPNHFQEPPPPLLPLRLSPRNAEHDESVNRNFPTGAPSYSLDFLHSVGKRMLGLGVEFPTTPSTGIRNNPAGTSGKSNQPQPQQQSGHRSNRYNGGGGGYGHNNQQQQQQQQPHHHHHHHPQPQQLTIASFIQKDMFGNNSNRGIGNVNGGGGGGNNTTNNPTPPLINSDNSPHAFTNQSQYPQHRMHSYNHPHYYRHHNMYQSYNGQTGGMVPPTSANNAQQRYQNSHHHSNNSNNNNNGQLEHPSQRQQNNRNQQQQQQHRQQMEQQQMQYNSGNNSNNFGGTPTPPNRKHKNHHQSQQSKNPNNQNQTSASSSISSLSSLAPAATGGGGGGGGGGNQRQKGNNQRANSAGEMQQPPPPLPPPSTTTHGKGGNQYSVGGNYRHYNNHQRHHHNNGHHFNHHIAQNIPPIGAVMAQHQNYNNLTYVITNGNGSAGLGGGPNNSKPHLPLNSHSEPSSRACSPSMLTSGDNSEASSRGIHSGPHHRRAYLMRCPANVCCPPPSAEAGKSESHKSECGCHDFDDSECSSSQKSEDGLPRCNSFHHLRPPPSSLLSSQSSQTPNSQIPSPMDFGGGGGGGYNPMPPMMAPPFPYRNGMMPLNGNLPPNCYHEDDYHLNKAIQQQLPNMFFSSSSNDQQSNVGSGSGGGGGGHNGNVMYSQSAVTLIPPCPSSTSIMSRSSDEETQALSSRSSSSGSDKLKGSTPDLSITDGLNEIHDQMGGMNRVNVGTNTFPSARARIRSHHQHQQQQQHCHAMPPPPFIHFPLNQQSVFCSNYLAYLRSTPSNTSSDLTANTPPDRFMSRSHLVEVKEAPKTLLNNSKWDQLSQQIWTKFVDSQQTEETYKLKMRLWRYLYITIKQTYPRYGLYLVGSTMSGFGADTSDVDMCLVSRSFAFVEQRMEALFNLTILQECLRKTEDLESFKLIEAKVPILRFRDKSNHFEVDLNFNNSVGIKNTHLLYCYTQLDWRLRPLALIVKLWAQYHDINNAKNMTISSYSLVLMVIHFLQCGVSPPVLPCLHKMYPEKFTPLRSNDFGQVDMNDYVGPYESNNTQTLGELFLNFLEYYSSFDYRQNAISVRTGGLLPVNVCRQAKSFKNDIHQWKELCIEEPFDLTNTARSVYDFDTFERVKAIFSASFRVMQKTLDLNSIFAPLVLPRLPISARIYMKRTPMANLTYGSKVLDADGGGGGGSLNKIDQQQTIDYCSDDEKSSSLREDNNNKAATRIEEKIVGRSGTADIAPAATTTAL